MASLNIPARIFHYEDGLQLSSGHSSGPSIISTVSRFGVGLNVLQQDIKALERKI